MSSDSIEFNYVVIDRPYLSGSITTECDFFRKEVKHLNGKMKSERQNCCSIEFYAIKN
eukprot:Pgem_evm1s10196